MSHRHTCIVHKMFSRIAIHACALFTSDMSSLSHVSFVCVRVPSSYLHLATDKHHTLAAICCVNMPLLQKLARLRPARDVGPSALKVILDKWMQRQGSRHLRGLLKDRVHVCCNMCKHNVLLAAFIM